MDRLVDPLKTAWVTLSVAEARELLEALQVWAKRFPKASSIPAGTHT